MAHAQEELDKFNESVGVNLTLEEGFGARHSGMAITFAGFHSDANAVANAPAAMNDVDDFTFSTSHAEKFGEAKFDDFALLIPFETRSTLGLGISRYGVSEIEGWKEGVSELNPIPLGQFSVADYLLTAAFARRWGALDLGTSFNFLYRQLDQEGMGLRGDAMAQYTWRDRYRLGALIKGLIPSTATWETGYTEYEVPDLHLGYAARIPAPYFYGTLQIAYQSEGLFQKRAKAQGSAHGSRFLSHPGNAFLSGNTGVEFLFDFGLAVRVGISELGMGSGILSTSAFGLGYSWKQVLGLDYSFTPHPDLLASHRIALQFTPAFPNFNGRHFRPGSQNVRRTLPKAADSEVKDDVETEAEIEPMAPAEVKPESITPVDPVDPVAPKPIVPTPIQVIPEAPKAAPAAPQPAEPKEQLEEEEIEEEADPEGE